MARIDSADGLGSFVGYVSTAPDNLDEVLEIYKRVLLEVEENGFEAEEWARAQRKLATSLTLRGETPFGRLMSLGSSYLYNAEYQSVQDVIDAVFGASLDGAAAVLESRPFSKLYTLSLRPG